MNRLKELRKAHKETQEHIAKNVVFRTVKTYRKYETTLDFDDIPLKDACALANHYNVTIDYLCGRSDCTKTDSHYIEKVLGLSQAAQDTLQALNTWKQKDNSGSASEIDIINFLLSNSEHKFNDLIHTLRLFILKNEFSTLCTMIPTVENGLSVYEPLPYQILLASDDTRTFGVTLNTQNLVETSTLETMHKLLYELQAIYEKEHAQDSKKQNNVLPGQMNINDFM